MKIIIAGSRNFNNYNFLENKVNELIKNKKIDITEIVSGKAKGADFLGEKYASLNNISIKVFPADWNLYGKKAGFLRNQEMGNYADILIAFWDGNSKGTKHMIEYMKVLKKQVFIFNFNTAAVFALYTPTLSASVDNTAASVNGNQVINSTNKTTEIPLNLTVNTNNKLSI